MSGWIVEIFMWPIFLFYFKLFEIWLRHWTACPAVEVSCSNVDPQMGGSNAASRTQPARKEDEEEEFRAQKGNVSTCREAALPFRKCRCYSLIIPLRFWTTGSQGCILAEVIFPIYFDSWYMSFLPEYAKSSKVESMAHVVVRYGRGYSLLYIWIVV